MPKADSELTVDEPTKTRRNGVDIDEVLIDLVDEHFPKGKCKERGNAMVLLAYFFMWHNKEQVKLLDRLKNQRYESIDIIERFKGGVVPMEAIRREKTKLKGKK